MDQPSDTSSDNPFKPEEEATFNESATESTGVAGPVEPEQSPPAEVPAQPAPERAYASTPSPFEAPADPVTETPLPPAVAAVEVAPATEGKKKKKWIPLAVAVGVLVLMGGSASAYYFGVYQNSDNVLYDAYSHLASAKAMQASGSITFDMPVMSGVKLKSIDYSGNFESNPSGMMSITAKMTLMSADVSVGGKGMVLDNGDMYFQLSGLVDAFKAYAQAMGAADSTIPSSFYASLGKLQDQWVKVAVADLKQTSEDTAKSYQCVIDAYKKHKDDGAKPLLEAYKQNAFMVKKEDLGTKDGRIGYKLAFDTTKAKEFASSVKDTDLAKDLAACDSSMSTDSSNTMDTSSAGDISTNVWIDMWTHELKRVEYSGAASEGTSKLSFTGNVDIAYDTNVTTTAPASSITLDEFGKRIEAVGTELYGGSSSETTIDSVANIL